MAASPSSRLSSPLSDVASPPEDPEDIAATPTAATAAVTAPRAAFPANHANGSRSRSPESNADVGAPSPNRSQRSPTSSTVERPESERAESDLTDMSDDGPEEDDVDDDEEGGADLMVDEDEGIAALNELASGANGTYAASVSSSQSLSPAPSSTERKPKPLPHIVLNVKQSQDQSIAASRDSEVESDLGSITDSNEDEDEPEPTGQDDSRQLRETGEKKPLSGNREGPVDLAAKNNYEDGMEEEDDLEEEEEEDGDGDVTMRAVDGLQALADEANLLPNGTGPSTEDRAVDESVGAEPELGPDEDINEPEEGEADEQPEQEEAEAEGVEQENGEAEGDGADDEEEAPASPALSIQPFRPHSTHAPPPTTAAMKALLSLEVKFAALRDRLYVERMEETAAEEEMILNGSHPALGYMFKNLLARRERLHEVASRRHRQVLEELAKVREEEKECVWTWWTEERDREQWEEFEQTWAKRRRLIREKSELDVGPKRPKPVPKSWADQPKPLDWAAGAVPSTLSARDAAADLALMLPPRQHGGRQASSPSLYGFTSNPPTASYYQHSHIPHPVQPEPVYASRVPTQHPQTATNQNPLPRHGPSGPVQGTYGNAVFNVEPRREGRTVPTTSGLFDTARRPPSNELPNHPGPSQAQPPPQLPQAQMPPTHNAESKPLEPWNHQASASPAAPGYPNANAAGAGAKGPSPVNGTSTAGPPPTSAIPPVKDETSATTAATDSPVDRFRQRYPGLSNYLQPSPPNHASQAQRIGALSPPKSSLGITGVPTPFI